ncbi:hypothetical protein [Methylobacterium sp. V23]|uniref:hypothetical protein n=1 Tax=Methylobacterium sp. V23 TaxID=2044878 RepID=UPI000CDB3218|nr:hypothetical protein [Methylobacterium sp. V23]
MALLTAMDLDSDGVATTVASKGGGYRTLDDIGTEAGLRRLRFAFFVTALPLELAAVRAHLLNIGAVGATDGTTFECGTFADRGQNWLIVMGESRAGGGCEVLGCTRDAYRDSPEACEAEDPRHQCGRDAIALPGC